MGKSAGQGPSWKKRHAGEAPRQAGQRSWQHGSSRTDKPITAPGKRRGWKRVITATAFCVLLGVMICLIYFLRATPPLRIVALAYADPVALNQPLNTYNEKLASELQRWCREEPRKREFQAVSAPIEPGDPAAGQSAPVAAPAKQALDALLRQAKMEKGTVVFFLGMPGDADEQLDPFLWVIPPGAAAPRREHRLYIRDLLSRLKELPDVNKVLVIDGTQTTVSWLHGMIGNRLAQGLKSAKIEEQLQELKNCAIVCASDINERSWLIPEYGLSNFGRTLIEALRGVDRPPSDTLNITLAEVAEALQTRTDRWSRANRGEPQRPFILRSSEALQKSTEFAFPDKKPVGFTLQARDTAGLASRWQDWDDLAGRTPAPQEASPHVWKQYTELLLRLEKLVSAGHATEGVLLRLGQLKQILEQSAAPLTQPFYRDLYGSPAPGARVAQLTQSYRQLWQTAPADEEAKWKEFAEQMADSQARLQALLVGWRLGMEAFPGDPALNSLMAADHFFAKLEASFPAAGTLRPMDVHLLRSFFRHNQRPPWNQSLLRIERVKPFFALRRQADQIAYRGLAAGDSGSEFRTASLVSWTKTQIGEADSQRRQAEDLLFDAHEESWAKADALAAEARKGYEQAESLGRTLLTALQARDQALYRLPYYSRWLAQCTETSAESRVEENVTLAREAWNQTQALSRLLLQQTTASPEQIRQQSDQLRQSLKSLQRHLMDRAANYQSLEASQSRNWQTITAALESPCFGDSPAERVAALGIRKNMLRNLSKISLDLAANRSADTNATTTDSDFAIRTARRTEMLFRASLPVELQTLDAESLTPAPAVAVLKLLGQARDQAVKSLRGLEPKDDAAAEQELARSSHFYRQLDPGIACPLSSVDAEADFLKRRFFLWLGDRAAAEGWADLTPGSTPENCFATRVAELNRETARGFHEELVKTLALQDNAPLKFQAPAKAAAVPSLGLLVNAAPPPAKLALTDQLRLKMNYSLRNAATASWPVLRLWTDDSTGLQLDQTSGKHFSRVGGQVNTPTVWQLPEMDAKRPGEAGLHAQVLYRGHTWDFDTEVKFIDQPNLTWERSPPTIVPGIVVFADPKAVDGHIHILFDVTASMTENMNDSTVAKIQAARDSLRETLEELPRGVQVSVSTFSASEQDPPDRKQHTRVVYESTHWNPTVEPAKVLEAIPNGQRLDQNANQTPILLALDETLRPGPMRTQLGVSSSSHFTLLMITDGVDTKTRTQHFGRDIVDILRRQENRAVEFHLVLFALSARELANQRTKEMVEELKYINSDETLRSFIADRRTPPRLWDQISSKQRLSENLSAALRPRFTVYQNEKPIASNVQVKSDLSQSWSVVPLPGPDHYEILLADQSPQLRIGAGDRLALKIKKENQKNRLFLQSIADIAPAITEKDPAAVLDAGELRLTMLEQRLGVHNNLELSVALEKLPRGEATDLLVQQRPMLAWFALEPKLEKSSPVHLSVAAVHGEVAPIWNLRADPWPATAPGKSVRDDPSPYRLRAYWLPVIQRSPLNSLKIQVAKTGQGWELASDPLPSPSSRAEYTLEEIQIRTAEGRSWLYVRCSHDKKPVLMQLRRGTPSAELTDRTIPERHRYFDTANSVSAWFDLSGETATTLDFELDIYSLDALLHSERASKIDYDQKNPRDPINHLVDRSWEKKVGK